MPNYKLTYFNARGRAELMRYLFALADVKYEDVRVTAEEWAKLKLTGKSPFGHLPILEVDGKVMYQSLAIIEYLGREFGFHGKNNFEQYQVTMLYAACQDMFDKLLKMHVEQDEAKKAELGKEFQEFKTKWLGVLEKILQENGGTHFVGDRLTLGDLIFFYSLEIIKAGDEKVLEKTPALNRLWDAVAANPKIAAWRSSRPKTEH